MNPIVQTLFNGLGLLDLALLLARLCLGSFYVLARFRWVYDPSRPDEPWFNSAREYSLAAKVCECGFASMCTCIIGRTFSPRIVGAFVAGVEILAGLAVMVGLLTPLAALGLFFVSLAATWCTAGDKVAKQNPVDCVDWVSCYLWVVEPHLIILAAILVLAGPGLFSLDSLVLNWLG